MPEALTKIFNSTNYLVLSTYAIVASVLYHWGYWGQFGINVLQFMSLSEIVRSAIYPFVVGTLGIGIGVFIASLSRFPKANEEIRSTSKAGDLLRGNWEIVVLALIFSAFLTYFLMDKYRWVVPGIIVFLALNIWSASAGLFTAFIADRRLRYVLVTGLIGTPIASFVWGATVAEAVLDGVQFTEVAVPDSSSRFKYIGHAGDYVFYMTKDNEKVYMQKASEVGYLTLTRMTKKAD